MDRFNDKAIQHSDVYTVMLLNTSAALPVLLAKWNKTYPHVLAIRLSYAPHVCLLCVYVCVRVGDPFMNPFEKSPPHASQFHLHQTCLILITLLDLNWMLFRHLYTSHFRSWFFSVIVPLHLSVFVRTRQILFSDCFCRLHFYASRLLCNNDCQCLCIESFNQPVSSKHWIIQERTILISELHTILTIFQWQE